MRSFNRRAPAVICISLVGFLAPKLLGQTTPFTFLQTGYTQTLFGAKTSSFGFGGVGFAPNGDVWVKDCNSSTGPLRFILSQSINVNGSIIHPLASGAQVATASGCGMTNHPDGHLYLNTPSGVQRLDASTGVVLTTIGPAGDSYGIAVDPQTSRLVYPAYPCVSTTSCTLLTVDASSGSSQILASLTSSVAFEDVDGLTFDPTGNYIIVGGRTGVFPQDSPFLTLLTRAGTFVQQLPAGHFPDGVSFHQNPFYMIANNNDGTISRMDFPSGDLRQTPVVTVIASGGFRGDLTGVGTDGCYYVTQGGTRYANGTVTTENSVVKICSTSGQFLPPTGMAPAINPGGVFNAASNVAGVIAPGSIATAKGNFLLTSSTTAGSWPTSLNGLSMQFGGVQTPLYYVSNGQVNFQVPWELSGKSQAALTALVNGQTSPSQTVSLAQFAPGIFSMNAQGTGQGAIADNSSGQLVDTSHPATPGVTILQIYCTGLGPVTNQPPTGSAALSSPLSNTTTKPIVTIGGIATPVIFSGLAPGSVGEYVVDVQTPAGVAAGNAVSVVISVGGVQSNTVTIAMQSASGNSGATLTSVNPSSSAAGRILTVAIVSSNTTFVQGQTLANFGPGISVGNSPLGQAGIVTVTGPTSATAQLTVDPSAALGPRSVIVSTGTQTASLNSAFTVLAPPAPLGPLSITSTVPGNGAVNVSMTPSIQITFNEPLDSATVGPRTFILANSRSSLPAAVSLDSTGTIVTLTPPGVLTPNGKYTVTISSQVRNAAENPLGNPLTFSFTIVSPTTVAGTVVAPSGLDPTSLRVLSFGGTVTTPNSRGEFSASLSPLGNSLVAVMLPGKTFGFLAVTNTGSSANSTPNTLFATPAPESMRRVYKTRWQVTASVAAASNQNNLVGDFQTTAEALVFMTPYLFTKDPQKAQVILSTIASSSATSGLAQALAQSWSEPDPLSDTSVQSAVQNAVLAAVQTLAQQTRPIAASARRNSHAREIATTTIGVEVSSASSASPALVSVTPNCWPNLVDLAASAPELPCLDLNYLSFQGSTSVDPNTGDYGFSPQNCFQQPLGCAVSWLLRITPVTADPHIIVGGFDSFGPESPIVSAEPEACSPCWAAWIPGNSIYQYLDVLQDVVTGASVEWQKLGLPNLLATGPNFILPSTAQQTYIVRAYSGGLADFNEIQNVLASKYPNAREFGSAALGINLVQELVDFIDVSTLGVPKTLGLVNFFTCELTDLVTDFVSDAGVAANATTPGEMLSQYRTILTSALGQTLSCAADAGLQALIKVISEAGGALTAIGDALDVASQVGSAAASGGDLVQRITDLAQHATVVETAVIVIEPSSVGIVNPIPSLTSLSPMSATAGATSLLLIVKGNYFLSNSTVTFKGSQRRTTLTPSGDLTIQLDSSDLAVPGTLPVVVTNPAPGGGASNSVNFIIAPPVASSPTLLSLTLTPTSVVGGNSVSATVTLSGPAPAGGVTVTLNSSNGVAQLPVPPMLSVAGGQSSATFTILTTGVTSSQTATITASLGTSSSVTSMLTITPSGSSTTSILSVTGDCASQGALNNSFSFGVYWTQTTSFYNVNIAIPVTTGFFDSATSDGTPVLAFLTHKFLPGTTVADEVAHTSFVIPPRSTPNTLVRVFSGLILGPGNYFLTLYAPTQGNAGGWCVTAGAPNVSAAPGVMEPYTFVLTGYDTYPPAAGLISYWDTAEILITGVPGPPPPSTATLKALTLSSTSVAGGTSITGAVTLSAPAPSGGVPVAVTSNNPSVKVPASVTVAAGESSASFTITTTSVASAQTVTITATLGASTVTGALTVSPPASSGPPTIYTITGNLNIAGRTVSLEIDVASGFIVFSDSNSFASGLDIVLGFNANVAQSGNTISYQSTSISSSEYVDISNSIIGNVTSATITITFQSFTGGTSVTGTVNLNVSGSNAPTAPIQGTFTGTLSI